MRKTNTGFTMIELMITIVIASILLTLAVPSFQDLLRNNRLTAQSNDLVTAINLARAEATKRRSNITICPSTNQTSCANASWQDGWIVRNDSNNEVLRYFPAMRGSTAVTSTANQIRYTQRGFLNGGTPVSLTLCAEAGKAGRQINITGSGRPSTVSPHPVC